MELKDTVEGMLSSDYKERFKAEYQQLKIRLDKLSNIISGMDKRDPTFNPICSKWILAEQRNYMQKYLEMLDHRAQIEGIDLDD